MELAIRFLFLSYLLYEICENLHYESLYFKELHNDQELDYEKSPFFLRDSTATETRARVKINSPFSRGLIFTRARVSLVLHSLRKIGDYS